MKPPLGNAFSKLRKLDLEISTEDYIELSNIMCNLANEQFDKGMKATTEIYTKHYEQ